MAAEPGLSQSLHRVIQSQEDASDIAALTAPFLHDRLRATAFGTAPEAIAVGVQQQREELRSLYPVLAPFCQRQFGETPWLETLWLLWLPLASRLRAQRQTLQRPFVQGILGGQGTGKTTLGKLLSLILGQWGYRTLSLSLDDLYKTHAERQQLRDRDPRLIWRGPPGTHNVEQGIYVLDALRQRAPTVVIPRFDKSLHNGSGDQGVPEIATAIDLVLFEGWFVGARPIDPACFDQAPHPITTDLDRAFARDMNAQLAAYLPLWDRCDSLMVLYPVDYRFSQHWRKQAEKDMQATGKPGMSETEIEAFVEYFWKALHPTLFIDPLVKTAGMAEWVIELDRNHHPGAVYQSGDRHRSIGQ